MPFNTALQHHPAATFHSRGGISILAQSWSHRALCNEQMSSFYTISPTPILRARRCKSSAAAGEVEMLGKRQRQCESKQVSAPLLAGRFIVRADVCAFPAGGSNVREAKCFAKQSRIPLGTQVLKQLPSKPAAKAEAPKAWLFSDISLAVIQPPLEHQFPSLKIRANRASLLATCCSAHATAAWWEFWYNGRYNTHIQQLPDLFRWSTLEQEPCLTSCHRPNQASLRRLCPRKEPRYFLYKPSRPLAVTARTQTWKGCSCQRSSTATEELSSKPSPDCEAKGLQSRVTGIYSSRISQHIWIHPLASLNFNWSTCD